APSTELPLATSRPFRAGAVQKTQQVRSSPGSRAADDHVAPSGKFHPRRMTRSSAAATGLAQQANPAPLDRSCVQQSTCGEDCGYCYHSCICDCAVCCPKPEDIIPSNTETPGLLRQDGQPIAISCT
ncbi:unnamed protein product, partial [Laminaria digitata]